MTNPRVNLTEMADDAIGATSAIIDLYGPRLTTSKPCMDAGENLRRQLGDCCDQSSSEEFIHSGGITHFLRWMISCYVLSLVFLWLNIPQLSLVCQITSFLTFVLEYLLYFEFIDRFMPSGAARNVFGVIEPSGTPTNCVIFSGHHDSARIYNFFEDFPSIFLVREMIFLFVILSETIWLIFLNVQRYNAGAFFGPETPTQHKMTIAYSIGFVFVLPLWFYFNSVATPGAGDNLISSCMGLTLAKFFSGDNRPKNTRLMFVSFDGEEVALRGSRAFFKKHKQELHEIKTWHFNVDCPYVADEIKFLTTDINSFYPLSTRLASKCVEIAHELGYKRAQTSKIMFLGGGTDAGEASRAGIEATTLLAMPFSPKDCHGKSVVYHTRKDTIDALEKEVIEATLGIFIRFVQDMDEGKFPA
jgi:hypothetical protein